MKFKVFINQTDSLLHNEVTQNNVFMQIFRNRRNKSTSDKPRKFNHFPFNRDRNTNANILLTTKLSVQTTTISISATSCSLFCMFRQPFSTCFNIYNMYEDEDPLKELDRLNRKYLLNYYLFTKRRRRRRKSTLSPAQLRFFFLCF